MKKLSLKQLQISLSIIFMIMLCVFGYVSSSIVSGLNKNIRQMIKVDIVNTRKLGSVDMYHDNLRSNVYYMLFDHDRNNGKNFKDINKEYEDSAKSIVKLAKDVDDAVMTPELDEMFKKVRAEVEDYAAKGRIVFTEGKAGTINSKSVEAFESSFQELETNLYVAAAKLEESFKQASEDDVTAAEAAIKKTLILLACCLVLGGGASIVVYRMISKNVDDAAKASLESQKLAMMVELSPVNTMLATPEGVMTYMNQAAATTLKQIEKLLPVPLESLMNKSIDHLHKNPEVPRRIIADPKNLPYKTSFKIGPETVNLLVSAISDKEGKYIGPMATWEIVTSRVSLVESLTASANDLATSANNVLAISSNLSAAAEETSAQANTASVASEEVNAGVQTVAGSMEEMVASIKGITKVTTEASSLTSSAMQMAKNADQIINQLGDSSNDIGNVTKVISSIAQQTNLLALNATIEAARAGEAGKGFAVVANEVKELAKQTAKATADITKKIENIQSDSRNAVSAIAEISAAIEKVNGYAGHIAASVEEQAATTNEVTRIVTESAEGVKQISENINQVSEAAGNTGKDANGSQLAAKAVAKIAEELKKQVEALKP